VGSSEDLESWEKLRKDRPSSLSKDSTDQSCLEGLQEVSRVTRKWTGPAENHLVIRWIKEGRMDGRNHLMRFHEI
jgi:hypothetical protein